jgi:hypothetical protein
MRKHLTYANVAATLALVFAMSGGALAAKHYLVTKTSQISPKVLKSFAATDTALFKKLSKTVVVTQAASATTATNATHATSANTAGTATSATTATSAATAGSATTAGSANSAGALTGIQIVKGPDIANPRETQRAQEVVCPSGMHAIGGGVLTSGGVEQAINETLIADSGEGKTNDAFEGIVNNTSTTKDDTFHVWALCANGSVSGDVFTTP